MKNLNISILFIFGILFLTTCSKEPETTGTVKISIDNQNEFLIENFFVEAGIVFLESDDESLIDLGRRNITDGGIAVFTPETLNVGNYYVRFQYFNRDNPRGEKRHQSFQIQGGEETIVEIIH